MELTYEFDGLDELITNLGGLWPDETNEEIYASLEASLGAFQQAVMVETPVGVSGNLKSATAIEITGTPVDLVGLVVNPLIYSWPVEKGRAAGRMPPVEAIELWVIRKGFQWMYNGEPMTTRQMAYVIARAIGAGTTKFQKAGGAKMFERGFEMALPEVERYWSLLPDRIVARLSR